MRTCPRRMLSRARPADRGARRGRCPTRGPLPEGLGGAVCPNLPQRPGSSRSVGGESLIFRAFVCGRSRPGAPLWQIWTRSCPRSPQAPHPHHPGPTHPRIMTIPAHVPAAPGEKGSMGLSHQSQRLRGDRRGAAGGMGVGGQGGVARAASGGAAGPRCAVSEGSGRCCTFDRDRPATDRRNHAETPRRSTPLKSSHVQRGPLCTWEPAR